MNRTRIVAVAAFVALALSTSAYPQNGSTANNYLLQSPSAAQAQEVCQRYGFQMVRPLNTTDLFLVSASSPIPPGQLKQLIQGDANIKQLEPDSSGTVPEIFLPQAGLPTSQVTSASASKGGSKVNGAIAWTGYLQQPVLGLINTSGPNAKGGPPSSTSGIIAIIDTGIDPNHPALAGSLVSGYDFTRNVAGNASEMADLTQSTAAILESNDVALQQSTAAILEGAQVVQLNQSTAAILEQSTAAILEGQAMPAYFGHGTMVAGLIHLVAPQALIMPLKAFNSDGTANTSDIVNAIYYAADQGATVINMSFGLGDFSPAVMRAVNYATQKGAICVASAGNQGEDILMYPSALGNVISVASTTTDSTRTLSLFSNFGSDAVKIAAPGEGLITTYPGGHYAAVWGTSFSAALVSGSTNVIASNIKASAGTFQVGDAIRAYSQGSLSPGVLGYGSLDVNDSMSYIMKMKFPSAAK
jgi:subtilisin family serine protease